MISGTTCVTTFFSGNKIYVANAGDSRCIICSHTDEGLTVEQLSRDHKPDLEEESQRILKKNGKIEAFKGKPNLLIVRL